MPNYREIVENVFGAFKKELIAEQAKSSWILGMSGAGFAVAVNEGFCVHRFFTFRLKTLDDNENYDRRI